MNTQHTPGPWACEEVTDIEWHVFDLQGEAGLIGPVAVVKHGDPDELTANARLIAAAPELLDALQMITILASSDTASAKARIEKIGSIARVVIAKARGE